LRIVCTSRKADRFWTAYAISGLPEFQLKFGSHSGQPQLNMLNVLDGLFDLIMI
jgi:hypothetical protein